MFININTDVKLASLSRYDNPSLTCRTKLGGVVKFELNTLLTNLYLKAHNINLSSSKTLMTFFKQELIWVEDEEKPGILSRTQLLKTLSNAYIERGLS